MCYFTLSLTTKVKTTMRWFRFSAWTSLARSAETIRVLVEDGEEEPRVLHHEWSPRSSLRTLGSIRQPIFFLKKCAKHVFSLSREKQFSTGLNGKGKK
jgi:hypothetical protein